MENAIEIYTTPDGETRIDVRFEQETVWMDAHSIAQLFDVQRPAIVKHIGNIYKSDELDKNPTCSVLEQVAADGKIRKMNFYNLDLIISVGYRVNSRRATRFRQWATSRRLPADPPALRGTARGSRRRVPGIFRCRA